jgi:DNA-binding transcriptional MerR regulator
MMREQKSLALDELAAVTGAKPQAIQFFVQCQLLDPPDGEARYCQRHVERLAEIQAWEADGLTREAIRQRIRGFRNPWFTQAA